MKPSDPLGLFQPDSDPLGLNTQEPSFLDLTQSGYKQRELGDAFTTAQDAFQRNTQADELMAERERKFPGTVPDEIKAAIPRLRDRNVARAHQLLDTAIAKAKEADVAAQSPALNKLSQSKTFGEGLSSFADAPIDTTKAVVATSLAHMIDPLIGASFGALTGGPAGMVAGGFMGSSGVEKRLAVVDVLQEEGIELTDKEALVEALSDPEIADKVMRKALIRMGVVGGADALSMGFATKAPFAGAVKNALFQGGMQSGLGGGGEAAAQYLDTGEIKPGDVIAESIGELPSAAAETGIATFAGRDAPTQEVEPQEPVQNTDTDVSELTDTIESLGSPDAQESFDESAPVAEAVVEEAAPQAEQTPLTNDDGLIEFTEAGETQRPVAQREAEPLPEAQAQEAVDAGPVDQKELLKFNQQNPEAVSKRGELTAQQEAGVNDTNIEPTDAQIKAGNYKKGRVKLQGINIAIENPKGSIRKGTGEDGKQWQTKLKNSYGDIEGTTGADGDPIDVFVGRRPNDQQFPVYVVNQKNQDGSFDEHKVILGEKTLKGASNTYLRNYDANQLERQGGELDVVQYTQDAFKQWLKGDTTKAAQSIPRSQKINDLKAQISKLAAEERSESEAVIKQASKNIERVDSESDLLSAIGRAGGISRESVSDDVTEDLVNPRNEQGKRRAYYAGGGPVVRAKGGLTLDEMRESVNGAGYNFDTLNDFIDAVNNEVVGDARGSLTTEQQFEQDAFNKMVSQEEEYLNSLEDADNYEPGSDDRWKRSSKAKTKKAPAKQAKVSKPVQRIAKKLGGKISFVQDGAYKGRFKSDTGEIEIVVSQHKDDADIIRTALHEAVGHAGVRSVFGKSLNSHMNRIYAQNRAQIDERAKALSIDTSTLDGKLEAAEEYVAEMAETWGKQRRLPDAFNRLIVAIRRALKSMGVPVKDWGRAEIIELLKRARRPDSSSAAERTYANDISKFIEKHKKDGKRPSGGERLKKSTWHGTPHQVDRFSTDKINTGEGAQAYGWGLYFAEKRSIAEWYRDTLVYGLGDTVTFDGKNRMEIFDDGGETSLPALVLEIHGLSKKNKSSFAQAASKALQIYKENVVQYRDALNEELAGESRDWAVRMYEEEAHDFSRIVSDVEGVVSDPDSFFARIEEPRKGELLEVELDIDDHNLLAWDEFSQHPDVMKMLDEADLMADSYRYGRGDDKQPNGAMIYGALGSDQEAAQKLREAGIRGIKYSDASSRSDDGQDSYNYVVFNDADIEIVNRYRKKGSETYKPARRDLKTGRKAWNAFTAKMRPAAEKLAMAELRPEHKHLFRQYRQDVGKTERTAVDVARQGFEKLSESERSILSDVIEEEVQAGVVPPVHVLKLADTLTKLMRNQSQELIDLGMLSQEAVARWDGRYLPRFYAKHTKDSGIKYAARLFGTIRGNHMKARGMFEKVPVSDIEAWEKSGWQVRDERGQEFVESLKEQAANSKMRKSEVVMWRDYKRTERESMGEERDAIFRFVKGQFETGRDIALGRLYKQIADEVAVNINPLDDSWHQVPDDKVSGTQLKQYGNLAGMWVPQDVWGHLKAVQAPTNKGFRAYLKTMSFWKLGKVVLNPVAHLNNTISNIVMLDLYGIPPTRIDKVFRAGRDYKRGTGRYQEALDAGLFGNDFYRAEIAELMPGRIQEFSNIETALAGTVNRKMKILAKFTGAEAYTENMKRFYEAEDRMFKLAIYDDVRNRGGSINEAVTEAERYVFNYTDVPKGVQHVKNVLLPFFTYAYKAAPIMAETALTRPWVFAKWMAALGGLNAMAFQYLGIDEDEERKGLPDYMRGASPVGYKNVRLPMNTAEDDPIYLDMMRWIPMGDVFDFTNQAGGVSLNAPITPNHPAFSLFSSLIMNRDTFTGRDVYDGTETATEKTVKTAKVLLSQFMPNVPVLPGSYSFDKVMNGISNQTGSDFPVLSDWYTGYTFNGDPVNMERALLSVMGVKLRTPNTEREIAKKQRKIKGNIRDLKLKNKMIIRNQSIPESKKESDIEKNLKKIEKELEKLDEL